MESNKGIEVSEVTPKVNISLTGTTKSVNPHLTLYQGVTEKEIDDLINLAVTKFKKLRNRCDVDLAVVEK